MADQKPPLTLESLSKRICDHHKEAIGNDQKIIEMIEEGRKLRAIEKTKDDELRDQKDKETTDARNVILTLVEAQRTDLHALRREMTPVLEGLTVFQMLGKFFKWLGLPIFVVGVWIWAQLTK